MIAYGQTGTQHGGVDWLLSMGPGTGKSHTMQGMNEPPEMRGIIPNSFDHVFNNISLDQTKEFLVRFVPAGAGLSRVCSGPSLIS